MKPVFLFLSATTFVLGARSKSKNRGMWKRGSEGLNVELQMGRCTNVVALLLVGFVLAAANALAQNQAYPLWNQTRGVGLEMASLGDIDGDGFDDLIVGGWQPARRAVVFSGVDGKVLHIHTNTKSWYGRWVDGLGDINNDAIPDYIVGSNDNFAQVYSGRDHSVLFTLTHSPPGEWFGVATTGVGDVNKDGTPDFSITTKRPNAGPAQINGIVTVYSGRNAKALYTLTSPNPNFRNGGFGDDVDGADVDRDGYADVVTGDGSWNSVYVYSGRTGTLIRTIFGGIASGGLGDQVAFVGDVNRDTFPDLIAGVKGATVNGQSKAGEARVFSGKDFSILYTWTFALPTAAIYSHNT